MASKECVVFRRVGSAIQDSAHYDWYNEICSPHRKLRGSVFGASRGHSDKSPVHGTIWEVKKRTYSKSGWLGRHESAKDAGVRRNGRQDAVPILSGLKETRYPLNARRLCLHALEEPTTGLRPVRPVSVRKHRSWKFNSDGRSDTWNALCKGTNCRRRSRKDRWQAANPQLEPNARLGMSINRANGRVQTPTFTFSRKDTIIPPMLLSWDLPKLRKKVPNPLQLEPGKAGSTVHKHGVRQRLRIPLHFRHRQNFEDPLPHGHRRRLMRLPAQQIVRNRDTYGLFAANGSCIATYGTILVSLDLSFQRTFKWRFTVTDVNLPIIGVDFLSHWSTLEIDASSRRPIYRYTRPRLTVNRRITDSLNFLT